MLWGEERLRNVTYVTYVSYGKMDPLNVLLKVAIYKNVSMTLHEAVL
jgi:hypothetical protein